MKAIKSLSGILLCAALCALRPASAWADGVGISARAGTLGAGIDAAFSLVPNHLNLRLGANRYTYNVDYTFEGVRYDSEVDLDSQSVMLDWHIFGGSFRLSAGAFRNRNAVSATGMATSPVTIGDTTYTPDQIGTLSATVGFKPSASYLGIGWGNAVGKNKRWGFTVDLGVLFQDAPDVTLAASNPAVSQADLRQEEAAIEADIEHFDTYPVISLGLTFQF